MLAAMFLNGGIDAVRNPEGKVTRAARVTEPVSDVLGLDNDPATLVRVNGAVMIAGGALLALGRLPRVAALMLAGALVPTTIAGHAFWAETDETTRAQQRLQFFKNMSMLGGLLLAVADTEGRPSVAWRAKRAARRAPDVLPSLPHAA
jgi:uncharacterized membrane protein YphA (DoxX/SURF4 family)